MSLRWDMPDVALKDVGRAPSVKVFVALYALIQFAAVVLTLLNWPAGQPTMTRDFWLAILVVPFLLWVLIGGLYYHLAYEGPLIRALWWNTLRGHLASHWQKWTHAHLVLLDSVVLTSEDDLAERMLGLEGSAPSNPDKVLVLPGMPDSGGRAKLELVLERLLAPLAERIAPLARVGSFDIVLQSDHAEHAIDLQRIWRKLGLPGDPAVAWLPADADSPLVVQWFDEQPMPDYRLVLACQLCDGKQEPASSEMVVALLLAVPDVAARSRAKFKPQAYLFRPVAAESDVVDMALRLLLEAQQAPPEKLKHFWFSRLAKPLKHAATTAVTNAGLNLAHHDLDKALGKPGPANGWLLQALAAQMVRHGQGAQLVAAPYQTGVAFNVVGLAPPPVKFWPTNEHCIYSLSWMLAMAAMFFVLVALPKFLSPAFLLSEPGHPPGVLAMSLFLFPIPAMLLQPLLALVVRHQTTKRFVDNLD